MKDLSLKRKMRDEIELLGYPLSGHPLDLFDTSACVEARDLHRYKNKNVTTIGMLISGKRVMTRSGKPRPMKFLSMEDRTGTFEVTLFPDAYERYAAITTSHGPYLVRGRVEDDLGAVSVNARHLEILGQ